MAKKRIRVKGHTRKVGKRRVRVRPHARTIQKKKGPTLSDLKPTEIEVGFPGGVKAKWKLKKKHSMWESMILLK